MFDKIKFIKSEDIVFEKSAVQQLNSFLTLENTIEQIKTTDPYFFDSDSPEISQIAITPDFHKGNLIPIGTVLLVDGLVIPQAMGSDINCGMRLYTTNVNIEKVEACLSELEDRIRFIFFEGGRNISMNKVQREAMLREGLIGILDTHSCAKNTGLWQYYDAIQEERDINLISENGACITDKVIGLEKFLGGNNLTYDTQIGTIGGGNHFVEIQSVSRICDAQTAKAWGLTDKQTVIMIHSGSLMIGKNSYYLMLEALKEIYPSNIAHPENGVYPLPHSEKHKKTWNDFWILMSNAANFAFANRMFIGLMMKRVFTEIFGSCEFNLLYDAPHNLVWSHEEQFLHRKGACPARGLYQMANTTFSYYGEPVLIPGSMGSHSFILCGLGNEECLFSASHGAGRKLSRGKAMKHDATFSELSEQFRVITPIDPKRPDIIGRVDILKKWEENIKSEAPYAYKDINSVIKAQTDNQVARVVAEMKPTLTIKN